MLAWLPENLVFGQPKIIDIVVVSGMSVAQARDKHYHNPPDYIVLEPEDTKLRTANLQQTNTNGYKFQGTPEQFQDAVRIVNNWGLDGRTYCLSPDYQRKLRELIGLYNYRLDTNFAKMDRIVHPEIENFKNKVLMTLFHGKTIGEWNKLLSKGTEKEILESLSESFGIEDEGSPVS